MASSSDDVQMDRIAAAEVNFFDGLPPKPEDLNQREQWIYECEDKIGKVIECFEEWKEDFSKACKKQEETKARLQKTKRRFLRRKKHLEKEKTSMKKTKRSGKKKNWR